MILIIGGCFQGKKEYAKKMFSLREDEILSADSEITDSGIRCVDQLHLRIKRLTPDSEKARLEENRLFSFCRDKIVISDDISCGIVPLQPSEREWRESTGRFLCRLAEQADCVIRIQCGLAQIIKGSLESVGKSDETDLLD